MYCVSVWVSTRPIYRVWGCCGNGNHFKFSIRKKERGWRWSIRSLAAKCGSCGGKNVRMWQKGKWGECVSLFSDSASIESGGRMIRMRTSHKYLPFSMPQKFKSPSSLPLSSLLLPLRWQILIRSSAAGGGWYLSSYLFLPSSFFPLILNFTTLERGGKDINYAFPVLPHLHLRICLFTFLFCSLLPPPPRRPFPLCVLNTINEQVKDRQTVKDGVWC